ncbi:MAG: hypothetical protein L0206_10410 [Actinobacteria bacterium]|nr:hypothetical protein [Actinomycetota bacterium]
MDRHVLLGLCATLNVAQAMLDEAGFREPGLHLNAAVVAIHCQAAWTTEEMARMADAQAWIVERIAATSAVRIDGT